MGPGNTPDGAEAVSRYLLDTTVLIGHLRGDASVTRRLLDLVGQGHDLGTSCVNVAEVEHGIRPKERRAVSVLLDRLDFLPTTREAAVRAGRYQAEFRRRGRTIHAAAGLIAGTARVHGAIIVT